MIICLLLIIVLLFLVKIFSSNNKSSSNDFNSKNDDSIKIMCIGDSITDGYGIPGSYRKFLYNGLIKKGYKIKMIGTKSEFETTYSEPKTGKSFKYYDNNVGYIGYTIKSYGKRKGIYEVLKKTNCLAQKPDIVILLIGTNNVFEKFDEKMNCKHYEILLDYIIGNIPKKSVVFVSTILDADPNNIEVYRWFRKFRFSNSDNDKKVVEIVKNYVKKFNSDITSIAIQRKEKGWNIRIADLHSTIKDVKSQLKDGVHPNDKGYKEMGDYLTELVSNYLRSKKNNY